MMMLSARSLSLSVVLALLCGLEVLRADICDEHGSPCRAPFGLDDGYEILFRTSCRLHSICYSCGDLYDVSKADCDSELRLAMAADCQTLSTPDMCHFQADNLMSVQTQVIGTNYYHDRRYVESWCIQHGVENCLPLNFTTAATP